MATSTTINPPSIPSYIPIPSSCTPIDPPSSSSQPQQIPISRKPLTSTSFPPSFPLPTSSTATRKFGVNVPTSASLSTNVSDLLLSSLLPANLPKLPASVKVGVGDGRVRELSSQREALSLPLVSNNFRRFVTKVGPVFWVQDRVEEVLFWRKPVWTYAYLLIWAFISFKPRLLLLIPSLVLVLLLLHTHERLKPLPTLIGTMTGPATSGTVRVAVPNPTERTGSSFTASTIESEGSASVSGGSSATMPVVPPKEAETGVDYYMNLQAIQNLMGLVSDAYDYIAPQLGVLLNPVASPTAFPITTTHILLVLLPPSLFLPLLPSWAIPYLLLPLGWLPPFIFHPNLTPSILALPRHPLVLKIRYFAEHYALLDNLSDELGRKDISRVEVWENERLDPAIASKPPSVPAVWGSKFLRAGERAPWVKVYGENAKWKGLGQGTTHPGMGKEQDKEILESDQEKSESGVVLALQEGWCFIPEEDWRVDVCGLWSEAGTDEDGWSYTDDSWQNPSINPIDNSDAMTGPMRKVTRRRRWYKRVYKESEDDSSPR